MPQQPTQIVSRQGASIDDKYAHGDYLSAAELAELPDDLIKQSKNLRFLTRKTVVWFGINDMMTLHVFPQVERTRAMRAEINTLFSFIDAILANGVEQVIVPNTFDISVTPGLYLARNYNGTTVDQETTTSAISELNAIIQANALTRPQVKIVDMFTIVNSWVNDFSSYGLKSLLRSEEVEYDEYLWADFLHMTSWAHKHLIAPLLSAALS